MMAKILADGSEEVEYDSMHINHVVEMKHLQLNDDEKTIILGNYLKKIFPAFYYIFILLYL